MEFTINILVKMIMMPSFIPEESKKLFPLKSV